MWDGANKIGQIQRWFFAFFSVNCHILTDYLSLWIISDTPRHIYHYIANNLIKYLVERYNTLLEWHPSLTYERMKEYAKVCKQLGGLRGKSAIWAFVDSTLRPFCWPKDKQQLVYSKYWRSHGMEWFVGVVPDGLYGFPYGSFEGKVNDIWILGLQRCLRQLFFSQGRWPLYLFDPMR